MQEITRCYPSEYFTGESILNKIISNNESEFTQALALSNLRALVECRKIARENHVSVDDVRKLIEYYKSNETHKIKHQVNSIFCQSIPKVYREHLYSSLSGDLEDDTVASKIHDGVISLKGRNGVQFILTLKIKEKT